jgi:hypothetical protein
MCGIFGEKDVILTVFRDLPAARGISGWNLRVSRNSWWQRCWMDTKRRSSLRLSVTLQIRSWTAPESCQLLKVVSSRLRPYQVLIPYNTLCICKDLTGADELQDLNRTWRRCSAPDLKWTPLFSERREASVSAIIASFHRLPCSWSRSFVKTYVLLFCPWRLSGNRQWRQVTLINS